MEVKNESEIRIRRRFPTDIRIRTIIVVPIYLFIVSISTFETEQYGFTLIMTVILGIFFILNHGMDWGYQFAYDQNRMSQRPKGWRWFFRRLPWNTIRFNEVSRVEAIHAADASLKAAFFPFEFILIYGRTGAQGDNIVIYPPAFHDQSVKKFLHFFDIKCRGKLPNEVLEYMRSDRQL